MGYNVLVVGSMNMDFTTKAKKLPEKGETVLGHDFKMSPGGKGANQAVAASKLGADVDFIGRVGQDFIGRKILKNMKKQGIREKGIIKDPEDHSGIALIMVDDKGDNIITVAPGTNMRVSKRDIEKQGKLIDRAEVLLFQLEIPLETITYAAMEADATVILNPAPAKKLPEDLLKNVDILAPNEKEATFLSGVEVNSVDKAKEAGHALLRKGVKKVVITLGEKGAVGISKKDDFHIESPEVNTVDTTGAGDAFCGALATYIKEMSFKEAVEYAVDAGALATTEIGAQQALPTKSELENFLS